MWNGYKIYPFFYPYFFLRNVPRFDEYLLTYAQDSLRNPCRYSRKLTFTTYVYKFQLHKYQIFIETSLVVLGLLNASRRTEEHEYIRRNFVTYFFQSSKYCT
jgi:hypothetical protein